MAIGRRQAVSAKKFTCRNSDITITWYARKQNTIVLHGNRSLILKNILIKVCKVLTTINEGMTNTSPVKDGELSKDNCMSAVNSSTGFRNTNDIAGEVVNTASDMPTGSPEKSLKNDVYAEKPKVRSNSYSCNVVHNFEHGCQCGILAADLEGMKLDMVIMQKVLESKISAVDNLRENDEINQLRKELSNEREKRKVLEADISVLIRGRNNEVKELNNTIISLEAQLKASEELNKFLRQSIMQINCEKAPKLKQVKPPSQSNKQSHVASKLNSFISNDQNICDNFEKQIIRSNQRCINQSEITLVEQIKLGKSKSDLQTISISDYNDPLSFNNQINYGRDTSLEKTNANVISEVSPLTPDNSKNCHNVIILSPEVTNVDHQKVIPAHPNLNVKPTQLEHTLQKKAISKQWLGHLPFVDLPKEKENTTKKEPRINNQKSSFRSQTSQTDWLTSSPLPWFRYEIQRLGSEWTSYLELVRRLT